MTLGHTISIYFKPFYDTGPQSLLRTGPQDARGKKNMCIPNRLHYCYIFTEDTQLTNIRAAQYQTDRRPQFRLQSIHACIDLLALCHFTTEVQKHVHESVHRDTTMKITNKMHYID